jgi:hypothetical protein
MLEALARALPLTDETGLRAALYLACNHGRSELREALVEAALGSKREDLRGMAAAALWDTANVGVGGRSDELREQARKVAGELLSSRVIGNVAWGSLIRAASKGGVSPSPVLTETPFRWIQWGWLE